MTTPPPPCECRIDCEVGHGKECHDARIIKCPLHAHAERLWNALEAEHGKVSAHVGGWAEQCMICALLTSCREKGG